VRRLLFWECCDSLLIFSVAVVVAVVFVVVVAVVFELVAFAGYN